MLLRELHDLGVDVSALLGRVLVEDPVTGLLHSGHCPDAPGGVPHLVPVSLDTRLCSECWPRTLSVEERRVLVSVDSVREAVASHRLALERGVAGDGFWNLVAAFERLPVDDPVVSRWALAERSRMLEGWGSAFSPSRGAARAAAVADFASHRTLSGREGLLVVSSFVVESVSGLLSPPLQRLLLLLWVPDSPFPVFTLRGPVEVVEHLAAALVRSAPEPFRDRVGWVALEGSDTPAVLEVAAGLFDVRSDVFRDVSRAFGAARAV